VTDAFKLWRFFAREIEADFQHFYTLDIRDWYSGAMDSRRFLTLVECLPDSSQFKKWAVRGGDWTEDQYVAARQVNEVALSRADGKGYMPQLVKSPMQLAQDEAEITYRRRRHDDTLKQLRGGGDSGDHD
jgi:hypothetical protein